MQHILLSSALHTYSHRCPHCQEPLFSLQDGEWTPHGQQFWLIDGTDVDSDPDSRPSAGRNLQEFLVGDCPYCNKRYFAIELTLSTHPGPWTADTVGDFMDFAEEWRSSSDNAAYIATPRPRHGDLPDRWLVEESVTPMGMLHFHTLGPFRCEGTCGRDDVAGMFSDPSTPEQDIARTLIRALWSQAVDLLRSRESDHAMSAAA